ncbi:hypothetical protein V8C42DRAFT_339098 [Trichoderma barbatum]
MSFKEAVAVKGISIEEEQEWKTFLVKGVPKSFTNTSGTQDTDTLIPKEAQIGAKAKIPPARCVKAPFGETDATANWFISFTEEVKKGFRVFFSAPAEEWERKARVIQCSNCQSFHGPGFCDRQTRCESCGKPSQFHQEETCQRPAQCANCLGPHKSDSIFCKARPKIVEGAISRPTREQMQSIKKLGFESFKQKNPKAITRSKERDTTPSPADRGREGQAASTEKPPQAQAGTDVEAMAIDLTSSEKPPRETRATRTKPRTKQWKPRTWRKTQTPKKRTMGQRKQTRRKKSGSSSPPLFAQNNRTKEGPLQTPWTATLSNDRDTPVETTERTLA